MRFRLGVLAGFGAGYVLGTQAGRARYEQIQEAWGKLMGTPQAQQLTEDVRVAASKASDTLGQVANEGVAKVTELVRGGEQEDDDTSTDDMMTPATPITPPTTGAYGESSTGGGTLGDPGTGAYGV